MAIFRPIPHKVKASVDDVAVNESLKDLEHHLRNNQFNNARATLRVIMTRMPGVKNYNIQLLNTLTSVEEGRASEELSMTKAAKEVKEAFQLYRSHIQRVLDELHTPTQEEELHSLDGVFNLSKQTLLSFETHRAQIRDRIREQGVVVTSAPVLGLFAPMLDVAKLKANGFKSRSLEGYPVLLDQMVVGISTEYILRLVKSDGMRKKKMVIDKTGKSVESTTPEQRAEAKEQFLDTVLQKFKPNGQRLANIGGEVIFESASWFWLVPADHLKLWRSCTTSPTTVNSLSIKNWNFPFASK